IPDRHRGRDHDGLSGWLRNLRWLLWIYLAVILILILLGLGFSGFSYAVSRKGTAESLPGKGHKEYKLEKYSIVIQKAINETQNWNDIKSCIVDSKICSSYENKYHNDIIQMFFKERLNPIQSGCCKLPDECAFTYRGLTNWTKESGVFDNPDCKTWENDPKVLCFNCKSCKAGVADNLKQSLKKKATVNIVFLLLLTIVFCVCICAF
ncbi:hypothetical protein E1A91_D12G111100v1, partial [Gossypium mustelinum]